MDPVERSNVPLPSEKLIDSEKWHFFGTGMADFCKVLPLPPELGYTPTQREVVVFKDFVASLDSSEKLTVHSVSTRMTLLSLTGATHVLWIDVSICNGPALVVLLHDSLRVIAPDGFLEDSDVFDRNTRLAEFEPTKLSAWFFQLCDCRPGIHVTSLIPSARNSFYALDHQGSLNRFLLCHDGLYIVASIPALSCRRFAWSGLRATKFTSGHYVFVT
jgi:hypothetical protein